MKKIINSAILSLLIIFGIVVVSYNNNKKELEMKEENTSIFPKGDKLPNTYFTGEHTYIRY